MSNGLHRITMVALLLVGSAILLFSCKSETKRVEELLDAIRSEESENLTIIMSENGRKSYLFKTPLLEGYTLGRDPYREFRKGISITTYQDDSLTTVNAVLVANYAIYYENRQLWEAKGDVVVTKSDGTRLYTQQLFWNSKTKRIYSNVDTKLVTETDEIVGEGFESDEEMTQPRFRHWKGRLQVDTEQLQSGSGDDATDEAKGENNESQKRDADAPESKVKAKPMPKPMPKSLPQSRPQSKTKPQSKQRPSAVEPGMQPLPQGPAPKMGGAKMPPPISGKRPNSMREQGVKLDGNQELKLNSLKTN